MTPNTTNAESPAPTHSETLAESLANLVTAYVEGGQKLGTNWRNGLARVIQLRIDRIAKAHPSPAPTLEATPRTDSIPKNGAFHHWRIEDVFIMSRTLERELAQSQAEVDQVSRELAQMTDYVRKLERERADQRRDNNGLNTELEAIQKHIRANMDSDAIEGCTPAECVALLASQRDNARAEVERLKKERNDAVAFASQVERGEVSFAKKCDEQLERIVALPLGKTIHEGISDAVARVLTERDAARAQVAALKEDSERLAFVVRYFHEAELLSMPDDVGQAREYIDELRAAMTPADAGTTEPENEL